VSLLYQLIAYQHQMSLTQWLPTGREKKSLDQLP
jgi:hypothetical protein